MTDNEDRENLDLPPHDLHAEEAVLGSILKNPRAIHQVVDVLVPGAFYDVRNRLVFAAALSLVQQDIPPSTGRCWVAPAECESRLEPTMKASPN